MVPEHRIAGAEANPIIVAVSTEKTARKCLALFCIMTEETELTKLLDNIIGRVTGKMIPAAGNDPSEKSILDPGS